MNSAAIATSGSDDCGLGNFAAPGDLTQRQVLRPAHEVSSPRTPTLVRGPQNVAKTDLYDTMKSSLICLVNKGLS